MEVENKFRHLPIFICCNIENEHWLEKGHSEVNPFCETTFTNQNNKMIKGVQLPLLKGYWKGRDDLKNILTSVYFISKNKEGPVITYSSGYFKPAEYSIEPPEDLSIKKITHAKYRLNINDDLFDNEPNEEILNALEKAVMKTHLRETKNIELLDITTDNAKKIFEELSDNLSWNRYAFWTV